MLEIRECKYSNNVNTDMRNSSFDYFSTHYQFDPDNVQLSLKSQMARSFPYVCMCSYWFIITFFIPSLIVHLNFHLYIYIYIYAFLYIIDNSCNVRISTLIVSLCLESSINYWFSIN